MSPRTPSIDPGAGPEPGGMQNSGVLASHDRELLEAVIDDEQSRLMGIVNTDDNPNIVISCDPLRLPHFMGAPIGGSGLAVFFGSIESFRVLLNLAYHHQAMGIRESSIAVSPGVTPTLACVWPAAGGQWGFPGVVASRIRGRRGLRPPGRSDLGRRILSRLADLPAFLIILPEPGVKRFIEG
jgi:hypothetical protein